MRVVQQARAHLEQPEPRQATLQSPIGPLPNGILGGKVVNSGYTSASVVSSDAKADQTAAGAFWVPSSAKAAIRRRLSRVRKRRHQKLPLLRGISARSNVSGSWGPSALSEPSSRFGKVSAALDSAGTMGGWDKSNSPMPSYRSGSSTSGDEIERRASYLPSIERVPEKPSNIPYETDGGKIHRIRPWHVLGSMFKALSVLKSRALALKKGKKKTVGGGAS